MARYPFVERGERHLLLASRRSPAGEGTGGLVAELTVPGAHVQAVGCDVTERSAVRALLAGVKAGAPLTAAVHTAGVLDGGTFVRDRSAFVRVLVRGTGVVERELAGVRGTLTGPVPRRYTAAAPVLVCVPSFPAG
uniref:KR domain-containing protein n=1 Tax=Streptomyces sp. NBC_00008 TaxID=2903610 RepID=A0AAU2VHG3_9ACTN